MTKYLIIENDIVTNVVVGKVDGGVHATGNLINANIGDMIDDGEIKNAEVPKITYDQQRKMEYPDVGDQLDMLYHAMELGELPKAKLFFDAINRVKKKYSK